MAVSGLAPGNASSCRQIPQHALHDHLYDSDGDDLLDDLLVRAAVGDYVLLNGSLTSGPGRHAAMRHEG